VSINWRRLVFGNPFPTHHAPHARLPNSLALPVFASDALSSVSYATEEILLVLVLVGASQEVLGLSWPIGLAIAVLLGIVTISYRQTIHAYPQGGGAYRVSRENLGTHAGLTAGSALLIDYVLTVAVSISAGVAAITSAFPALQSHTVPLAVGFIIFIALANLRGARESGLLFAVPTYCFILAIGALIVTGLIRLASGVEMHPPQPAADAWASSTGTVTAFLVLRAFSSGCTALTGIEAVTDGVPAFRPPEARNAARVLGILGIILISLFVGITYLAQQLHVIPFPAEMEGHGLEHRHTVVSQIAYAVFGPTPFYYLIQVATAAILILAANTAYADFPRLCMFLAQDRYLPRQLANVGDRLVYSNGIIAVTVLSILTVVAFGASTHHLIPLYALGVFLSFTLSQSGMVARWLRLRPRGWQAGAAVSGVGAVTTCIVMVIIAVTKFMAGDPVSLFPLTTPLGIWAATSLLAFLLLSMWHRWMGKWFLGISVLVFLAVWGTARFNPLTPVEVRLGAWLVMVAIPVIVWMCSRINAHYREVAEHLTMARYEDPGPFRNTVLLLVGGVHRGIMPAVKYARGISQDVRAVYVEIEPEKTPSVLQRWSQWVPDVPLVVVESPYRGLVEPLLRYIDEVEQERDDDVITVIIPEFVTEKWWTVLLHGQNGLLLKWALLFKRGVVVTNIRYTLDRAVGDEPPHPLFSHLEGEAEHTSTPGAAK
jgi:amino acid transporter